MNVKGQIKEYITSQPEPKRSDMQELHRIMMEVMPVCKLWLLDGTLCDDLVLSTDGENGDGVSSFSL